MAKSLRCKREKRLRAIKRELVEPLYAPKEAAKLAAQEAALAAPKLPVRTSNGSSTSMDVITPSTSNSTMDVEMADKSLAAHLKPVGGVGKKLKKKLKIGKGKRHGKSKGKGKIRRTHI